MSNEPRYATLYDYLRVIRAQKWLILAVVLIFTGIAFALSVSQSKTYEARAALSFRDVGSDLNLLGTNAPPQSTPEEQAAVNAQLINRRAIAIEAKKRLKTGLSAEQIQSSVSAQVGNVSNLVEVVASSNDPNQAARIANAVAQVASQIGRQQEQQRINRAIAGIKRELGGRLKGQPKTFNEQVLRQQLAQLTTVERLAQPVQVAERAQPPTSPVSPKPARSAFLGALLGLIVGLILAFARDALDRRLRSVHDAHQELGLPVVGRVSSEILGSTIAENGAGSIAGPDLEAFRMLRTNLEFLREDQPLRTVLVTSGLPDEGKSTVAAGLAVASVIGGRRTLLVECDLRRPCIAQRFGVNPTPGITDFLLGQASSQDVLQRIAVPGLHDGNGDEANLGGIVCITAGSATSFPAEMLGSQRFREFLSGVRDAYDLVVLDTSPVLAVVDALELAPHVDGVIVCVRASQTTRDEARAVKAALDHLQLRAMGAVVTGLKRSEGYSYYDYSYAP